MMRKTKYFSWIVACFVLLAAAACGGADMPSLPQLPALPEELQQLPDIARQLGLPDLGSISNLPGLDALPSFSPPPGGIVFNGPTERRLNIGDRIPGTDIRLSAIQDSGAEFQIAGMRSVRTVGDSLDFDGQWPDLPGTTYNARLRLYSVGSDHVRVAGVHQLIFTQVQPVEGSLPNGAVTIRFPFTTHVDVGGTIAGTTLGYAGSTDRGGNITGLPTGDYPFRKVGDSIFWRGAIRPGIGADYSLRMLLYGQDGARVGGIVTLILAAQ